ncbi:MAG TPA: ArsR family transcriptional regulator [Methanocorpusculum sp.]|nr:ArsR family transcriptional regulator [Methanocorpusculum sp.]HJK01831.1 ArsR family transcriptional regulator [Methanocorpusculum sp.]
MIEQEELAPLLDILGNRNRRRILDLLRQKPCFVTEISERLVINPKAVIEHLAIMQKEDVIAYYQDDKRRKYYYLVQDFELSVQMRRPEQPPMSNAYAPTSKRVGPDVPPLTDKILMIQHLLDSREKLIENLEAVENDINEMINDVIVSGKNVFKNGMELEILLALIDSPLTLIELSDTIGHPVNEVTGSLRTLFTKGYVESEDGRYRIKGLQNAVSLTSGKVFFQ